jgi:hypothetical protein
MGLSWPEDLSVLSRGRVFAILAENRAWNKQLREGNLALVNARLAKTITQEEYAASRQRANADSAECRRRQQMLFRVMDRKEAEER